MQVTLAQLDTALIRARRVFEVPPLVADNGRKVESSTLLVLAALEALGPGATISEIADWLSVAHSTASRLVARAEGVGMVARGVSGADRREQALVATAGGRDLTARAQEHRTRRLAELLGGWSEADIDTFTRLMSRLAEPDRGEPGPDTP